MPRLNQVRPRRRFFHRPSRPVAIVIAVVATVLGMYAGVEAVRTFVDALDGPEIAVPGTTRLDLDSGRWIVFEATGSGFVTIGVNDVEVTDPDGNQLGIRNVTGSQTITKNGTRFTGAVEFTAPSHAVYTITVTSEGSAGAIVAAPLTDTFRRAGLWVLLGIVCLAVFIVGLVFAIVGPRRAPAVAPFGSYPPTGPAPGWYPDPSGAPNLRWWDGARWTGQVRLP